jgi:dipeptidase
MSNLKGAIAQGILVAKKSEEQTDGIAKGITQLFELLANTDPDAARNLLAQLNAQLTEEALKRVEKSHKDALEHYESNVVIPEGE